MIERVRFVDGEPRLVAGRCRACGHETFPRRERCPACRSSAVDETALGPEGIVESAVELHVSTAEADAPYTLGLVRVDGVTLLARIANADEPGTPVHLAADDHGNGFWFATLAHDGAASTSTTEPTTEETP